MTTPASADAQATVQAVQENAQRLGLTWARRRATVASDNPVMVVLDGDSEPVAATSMIGPLVADQRVYVDVVPPSGQFVSGIIDLDWIAPTLLNSWVNFGSGYQVARFRKLISGQVEIQGLITAGAGPGVTVFTLPVGYRPVASMIFATIATNAVARLDVNATGDVMWQAGGTNGFLSLNCAFTP